MDNYKLATDVRIFEFVMGFYQEKAEEDFNELCRKTYGKNHEKKYSLELALCQWASDKAYRDVCRTITFANPDKDKERMKRRMKVTEIICSSIAELCTDTNYDEWHENVCKEIEKIYTGFINDTKHEHTTLTVGQTQKWLNMTIKWLWLYNSCITEINYFQGIMSHTNNLHIPLDSFILAYIKKEYELDLNEISVWSQISKYKDVYLEYQIDFRKKLTNSKSPIEWELINWKNALNMNIKKQ